MGSTWPFFRRKGAGREILTSRREEDKVAKEDRGFASMDRAKQREIASKGGKAAHQKGTAHEWTSEEARDAGRKGGIASHRRRREAMGTPESDTSPDRNRDNMANEAQGFMRDESIGTTEPDREDR
jgi:general stress protein YciG